MEFFPGSQPDNQVSPPPSPVPDPKPHSITWEQRWETLLRLGVGETAIRIATAVTSLALILVVTWVMGAFYVKADFTSNQPVEAAAISTEVPAAVVQTGANPSGSANTQASRGIFRQSYFHSVQSAQPRNDLTPYVVQPGDTIYSIAARFKLQPETIMWNNLSILGDNPERLQPGQKLAILPVDGMYYEWNNGDGLSGVAKFFGVTPEDIIKYPGNHLDPNTIGDYAAPHINPGTKLIIPGGRRDFIGANTPYRTRDEAANPSLGIGATCGSITGGPVGTGSFLWPTTEKYLSGLDYSPSTNHLGIDIAGVPGNPVYAVDNGVVTYAGWSDSGYGNVIVIDHGNGWLSLYGHLSDASLTVNCGSFVKQGDTIAAVGATGNTTGPNLHFELRNTQIGNVNPNNYLTK
jgi:murein DD-endopeptidase MepM/ murein hydrolase activator NlpD